MLHSLFFFSKSVNILYGWIINQLFLPGPGLVLFSPARAFAGFSITHPAKWGWLLKSLGRLGSRFYLNGSTASHYAILPSPPTQFPNFFSCRYVSSGVASPTHTGWVINDAGFHLPFPSVIQHTPTPGVRSPRRHPTHPCYFIDLYWNDYLYFGNEGKTGKAFAQLC